MKRSQHSPFTLILTALVLSLLPWSNGVLAEVRATLSRNATSLEEPVRLELQVSGSNDASPDLSFLRHDFEILGRSSQQSVSIVNGKMSKTEGLTLTLLPKKTGQLTIPPITVGAEQTSPLTLEVTEVSYPTDEEDSNSAFIQLEVNKSTAYQQEEILLTVRLYQAAGVHGDGLSEPEISMDDTLLRLLHEEQYQAEHEGQSYRLVERRYALFAYHPGKLHLGNIRFRGRTGASGTSILEPVHAPYSSAPGQNRIIRTQSEQLEVEILPPPAAFTGERWLPARNLRIVERDMTADGPILAGRSANRRIMIIGDGLSAAQLPAIEMELPAGLKQYPQRPQVKDELTRDGISGNRLTNVSLTATEPGRYTLPAIEIPWWDTQTQRQELASLPAVTLEVLPNLGSSSAYNPKPTNQSLKQATPAEPAREVAPQPALTSSEESGFPTWLVWLLGAGWLATLAGWWLSQRRDGASPEAAETAVAPVARSPEETLREIIGALESAYRKVDREAARSAWLRWGEYRWPERPPSNLNRLASRCNHNIALAVSLLDRAFYSPENPDDWRQFDPRELLESDIEKKSGPTRKEGLIPPKPLTHPHGRVERLICRPGGGKGLHAPS